MCLNTIKMNLMFESVLNYPVPNSALLWLVFSACCFLTWRLNGCVEAKCTFNNDTVNFMPSCTRYSSSYFNYHPIF